jgi:hypothetical protein
VGAQGKNYYKHSLHLVHKTRQLLEYTTQIHSITRNKKAPKKLVPLATVEKFLLLLKEYLDGATY